MNSINAMSQHNSRTFLSMQTFGSEKQLSSTESLGPKGGTGNKTAAMDDVTMTLLTDDTLVQVSRTLSVPFTAGSISSICKPSKILKLVSYVRILDLK